MIANPIRGQLNRENICLGDGQNRVLRQHRAWGFSRAERFRGGFCESKQPLRLYKIRLRRGQTLVLHGAQIRALTKLGGYDRAYTYFQHACFIPIVGVGKRDAY